MPIPPKTLQQLNADSIKYLAENTDITFLSPGSNARGLVEATNQEISKLSDYITSTASNTYLDTAQGIYLDLIGDMLGIKRLSNRPASASVNDNTVQFSVATGTLGERFPDPTNSSRGVINSGVTIQTANGSIKYKTTTPTTFPKNATDVFVPVASDDLGEKVNVGRGKLVVHDGPSDVNVTNLKSIVNGSDAETDREYRFRLSNAIASTSTSNETSIRQVIAGIPDISRVELNEFARGAGTFDVLLVPAGNTITSATAETARLAIESVSAFGVKPLIREPVYNRFKISIQLIRERNATVGDLDSNKLTAKNAVINYFETIPLGGEFIVKRLRAAVIDAVSDKIKDIKILDLCINGRPRAIRNVKLKPDELFTPDTTQGSAVEII